MNLDNLHELINRYESNMDTLYNEVHDELFKWKAMKTWQREWTKPDGSFENFSDRFTAAKKDFLVMVDNARVHPTVGMVKLWEREPETVEHLFLDVLLGKASNDVNCAQQHMDSFVEQYELLRQKYYPGNWTYKQDRHSASVFLAMNTPDVHYIYKSSEASAMAKYTDFGFNIGSGGSFSLIYYYRLCEEIVAALREHCTLLEKHFNRLTENHYRDESLHLLAFDLMYCSRCYRFYDGLVAPATGKTIKKQTKEDRSAAEAAQREADRQNRINELQTEIASLESLCDDCMEISLLDVQVNTPQYGFGRVISQNGSTITVQFDDLKKSYILDKKYTSRPQFENADEVVAAFSEYNRAQERIKLLNIQLKGMEQIGR